MFAFFSPKYFLLTPKIIILFLFWGTPYSLTSIIAFFKLSKMVYSHSSNLFFILSIIGSPSGEALKIPGTFSKTKTFGLYLLTTFK